MNSKLSHEPVFDCDGHWYEPLDAFTRHVPKEWRERTVQVATIGDRVRYIVGGKIDQTLANPTFDPILRPGTLSEYFTGNPNKITPEQLMKDPANRIPIPKSYRERDARLKKMDEQRIDRTWLLPTFGMSVEEGLQFDPPAASVAFHAFNQWIEDDWGFNYKDRIYGSPYLAMGDVESAVKEVEWALKRGARLFTVRPTGTYTSSGWRSPGDPCFDPIWARINEAGVPVIPHVAETGDFGLSRFTPHGYGVIGKLAPVLQVMVGHDRPIENYLCALIADKLFERFTNLKIVSVENGSGWLPVVKAGLRRAHFQRPGYFAEDPLEVFKRHVWVSPFWEDKLEDAVAEYDADRIVWGSDWPHAESIEQPRDYYENDVLPGLNDPVAARKIMYENTAQLTGI
jgi:predicted TIM-barrel fold metal-dependent hydrolase